MIWQGLFKEVWLHFLLPPPPTPVSSHFYDLGLPPQCVFFFFHKHKQISIYSQPSVSRFLTKDQNFNPGLVKSAIVKAVDREG